MRQQKTANVSSGAALRGMSMATSTVATLLLQDRHWGENQPRVIANDVCTDNLISLSHQGNEHR